jgi:putative Holliday junction resolvase
MKLWLGLDYGARRIGVAVSDATGTLATALGTHRTPDDGPFFAWLGRLIAERGATGIVLGLPVEEAGVEGESAARVRAFALRLREETGLPVVLVDERYSSREAAAVLARSGRRRRPREQIDALAAEIILQQFLDRQRAGETGEGP